MLSGRLVSSHQRNLHFSSADHIRFGHPHDGSICVEFITHRLLLLLIEDRFIYITGTD